jgi:hypothetical protein
MMPQSSNHRGSVVSPRSEPWHSSTPQQTPYHAIMPPSTPPTSPKRQEYDTIRRMRFFDAFDRKKKSTSLGSVCRRPQISIPTSTARTWLKKRETLGSPALRRTRKIGSTTGPKPLISAAILATITDQLNPIHTKSYED